MKEFIRNLAKVGITGLVIGSSISLGVNASDKLCNKVKAKRTEKEIKKLMKEIEKNNKRNKKRR